VRLALLRLLLRSIQALDRWHLRRLLRRHPGLSIHPSASSNLAVARFELAPGAELRIGANVSTERVRGALVFRVEGGGRMEIGDGTWLRTECEPIYLSVFPGGRLRIGEGCWLSGCHLSAKESLTLGRGAWVGPGCRVFDADQHALDAEQPERRAPVHLGAHVWITTDVTVLRGVTVGDHSVVGARSVVVHDLPPHSLAFGAPARVHGRVGDRSSAQ
jgi:acetyltransferase-like isoleucine patch superfamily enzyme